MTASSIVFDWLLPTAGLALFAAGAWANADAMFGWSKQVRDARAAGSHVSLVPLVPGIAGAASLWNGPYEWMRAVAWVPLLLDVGCVPYMLLTAVALFAARGQPPRDEATADPRLLAVRAELAERKERARRNQQSFAGCLLGTAIGDALGLASEGLSARRQALMFPDTERYHLLPFGRGLCSDDTEHTIMVAQSLLRTDGFTHGHGDAQAFRADLAWRLRWWLLGLPAGIGMATLKGILKLWLFVPQRWQGVHSAGNGPSMRSALIGVYWANDATRMHLHVQASTRLTHSDPKAAQAALAVAAAASQSARDGGRVAAGEFAARIRELLGDDGAELAGLIDAVAASVQSGQSTREFAADMGLQQGVTGYAFHTVPVALHAWLAHPGDYRAAVIAAIRAGGDTDTVAAITGAIAGAGCGRDGLPQQWLDRLAEWPHSIAWMESLAGRLAQSQSGLLTDGQPAVSIFQLLARNLFFMAVVLVHGFRRLLPPY